MNTSQPPDDEAFPLDFAPGVHRLEPRALLDAALAAYAHAGWATAVVDLTAADDKPAILAAFARGLGFPGWVGRNWDALDDALGDLSWWPSGPRGRLLVVLGLESATAGSTQHGAVVRDVLQVAATSWSGSEQPITVLIAS